METRQSEELTLRQYLLGRLDAPPEISERLEERIFMDSDFAELVGVIEDEIIEDYLEGVLDPAEHDAVEKHFLRPRERQEKLRLARLVTRSLESRVRSTTTSDSVPIPLHQISKAPPSALWRPSVRLWAELSAGALLVLSLTYSFKAHQEAQTSHFQSSQELAAERGRSVQLERQIQDLRRVAQPATVMLSLLQPGLRRGDGPVATLQIGSGTQRIHVEIALQSAPPGPVDVRLENSTGKTIWTASMQFPYRSPNAALLILEVPALGIEPGDYRFVVSQPIAAGAVLYAFSVVRSH
jgi:hypothetical protein